MPQVPIRYVLLTGSDLGDRVENLELAAKCIEANIGRIVTSSTVLETEPWGFESDTRFLNQALLVESGQNPEEVLDRIKMIERKIGRKRNSEQWSSRIIDIDILCADQLIHHSNELTIPHKHLHERGFVLMPLCEIVPEWIHPHLRKSYRNILSELTAIPSSEKVD